MFCPNNVDWGSLADWVSGIGALLAALVAVGIAVHQHRKDIRLRQIDRHEAHLRLAQVRAEAIRLVAEIEGLALSFVRLVSFGGGSSLTLQTSYGEIAIVRSQLLSLQQLPIFDPRLFAEIGRAAAEGSVDPDILTSSTHYAEQIMRRLAERMMTRRTVLADLLPDCPATEGSTQSDGL